MYLQLSIDGKPTDAPVLLRPLIAPIVVRDELTARLREALGSADPAIALGVLSGMARTQRDAVAAEVRVMPAGALNVSGFKLSVVKRVRLETTEGTIELELRPDLAPNTCEHFERLVEGGFYDGVIFHRVVGTPPGAPASAKGLIVQRGDKTGTGEGHAGVCIDFEPSLLRHEAGVVSMARREDDPNSASSQFLICLDRETCASLDGRSTAFAEVVAGMEVVNAIASAPVGPRNPEDPLSPRDRPLVPPVIERAVLVDAPPAGSRAPTPPPPPPVPR
jgi:cyclophilin family peptidyl-prolyl cis-trans isomerase